MVYTGVISGFVSGPFEVGKNYKRAKFSSPFERDPQGEKAI